MNVSEPDGCHDVVSTFIICFITYCILYVIGLITGPRHVFEPHSRDGNVAMNASLVSGVALSPYIFPQKQTSFRCVTTQGPDGISEYHMAFRPFVCVYAALHRRPAKHDGVYFLMKANRANGRRTTEVSSSGAGLHPSNSRSRLSRVREYWSFN